MTQAEVNRAVAQATGETVRTIAQLGFGIADQDVVDHDPEPYDFDPEGKVLDGDAMPGLALLGNRIFSLTRARPHWLGAGGTGQVWFV